jgi:hypothetical protein
LLCIGLGTALHAAQQSPQSAEVVVYGGTPSGVMAAVAAARQGRQVLLVEPSKHLGGVISGGLTKTDIGRRETIGGLPAEFFSRVLATYEKTYGKDSPQPLATKGGIFFEPHVAEETFEAMLHDAHVAVVKEQIVADALLDHDHIASIRVTSPSGAYTTIAGRIFIDASYEGDLMAAAHVPYRVGREGVAEYNESLAGMTRGPAETIGKGDHRVQSFNIRSTITNRPDIRIPFPKPEHYMPEAFADFLAHIHNKHIRNFAELFPDEPEWGAVNGKSDPNKADDVGINVNYAEADAATRHAIYEHTRDLWLSFWYMLANDPSLSEEFKQSVRVWGLPKDEFADSGNITPTLYVREARRMIGRYIMTQKDVQTDRVKPDGIAIGSYVIDSHAVQEILMPAGLVSEGGNIAGWTDPYNIPYRAITPVKPDNLLVTVDLSATHIAYCTIRMEPVFMTIGQAAGLAASLSIQHHVSVQDVPVDKLRAELDAQKVPLEPMFRPRVTIELDGNEKSGAPVRFHVRQVEVRAPLTKYYWNFDGSGAVNSKDVSPTWTFATAKPIVVSLMVEDAEGHTSLIAKRKLTFGSDHAPDVTVLYEQAKEQGLWDKTAIGSIDERDLVAYHDLNNGKGSKSVRFEAKVSRAGHYRLAVAYPTNVRRATNVPVKVKTRTGMKTLYFNERSKDTPFAFTPLGDFHLDAGELPSVTISTENTDGDVAIEAIRWIWMGE